MDMPPPLPRPPGDLRRAAAANVLATTAAAGLPGIPGRLAAGRLGEDSWQQQHPHGAGGGGSGSTGSPHGTAAGAAAAPGGSSRGLSMPLPLPWADYFDQQQRVRCPDRQATFNVYTAGTSGPVVLCLHGGGYTGLSWALIAKRLKDRCRVVAVDLRCHGQTEAADELDLSAATLAADVVAVWKALFGGGDGGSDGSSSGSGGSTGSAGGAPVMQQQQQQGDAAQAASAATAPPPTVLVGHSMGGAIAVHAAALAGIPSLAGVVVIDVVEGTAIASLPYMSTVLQKRPKRFASLQQAVDWALDTGMCKRQEAAHVSLPSMLCQEAAGGSKAGDTPAAGAAGAAAATNTASSLADLPLTAGGLEPLSEEGEEEEEEGGAAAAGEGMAMPPQKSAPTAAAPAMAAAVAPPPPPPPAAPQPQSGMPPPLPPQHLAARAAARQGAAAAAAGDGGSGSSAGSGWMWRTPLEKSAPYWEGWYTGLSDMFLKIPAPKVLVLVGTDRLDRPLTIGQMQGKFQPVLLPQAGHAVHEDEPERTADAIATFIKRFRIGEPPLQIPRPAAGIRPVLPVPMGPAFVPHPAPPLQPGQSQQQSQPQQSQPQQSQPQQSQQQQSQQQQSQQQQSQQQQSQQQQSQQQQSQQQQRSQ